MQIKFIKVKLTGKKAYTFHLLIFQFLYIQRLFIEKKGWLKEVLRHRGLYSILTKGDKLWRSDKTKEKHFRALGVVDFRTLNIWGKLIKDNGDFSKVVCVHS